MKNDTRTLGKREPHAQRNQIIYNYETENCRNFQSEGVGGTPWFVEDIEVYTNAYESDNCNPKLCSISHYLNLSKRCPIAFTWELSLISSFTWLNENKRWILTMTFCSDTRRAVLGHSSSRSTFSYYFHMGKWSACSGPYSSFSKFLVLLLVDEFSTGKPWGCLSFVLLVLVLTPKWYALSLHAPAQRGTREDDNRHGKGKNWKEKGKRHLKQAVNFQPGPPVRLVEPPGPHKLPEKFLTLETFCDFWENGGRENLEIYKNCPSNNNLTLLQSNI